MTKPVTRDELTEIQTTIGILTDLVYDAAIKIEVLIALLETRGLPRSEVDRLFQETKRHYASKLKDAPSDPRIAAILQYIEGGGGTNQ